MPSESSKRKRKRSTKKKFIEITEKELNDEYKDDIHISNVKLGQFFHMDFGFVRGTNYTLKQEDKSTVTSKDGYNSCLILMDRATRYTWIFLTKSESPPVNIARKVLRKFNANSKHYTVRTDLVRELGSSEDFRKMVDEEGYALEITGAKGSS